MQQRYGIGILAFIACFFLIAVCLHMANQQQRKPISILAIGDSLTEGYYNYGRSFHSYAKHLTDLFDAANIAVVITQRGVSGERVVPTMVNRLRQLLDKGASYDWIIILGGTNDLGGSASAKEIFETGLLPMYEMCLRNTQTKTKLVVMTVIENAIYSPTHDDDQDRQALNTMIRNYVVNASEPDRVCLVDLDKGIPYHSVDDEAERQRIWDDVVHLKPAGYDRIATLIFDTIKSKL